MIIYGYLMQPLNVIEFWCTLATSTVLKSHQAGKVTSSTWHGGDTEKSHQVVESHIREEESPWHSLFHLQLEI